MKNLQQLSQSMYNKGYRYRIHFENDHIQPLFAKSIQDVALMMRETYKDEKNWIAHEIDHQGNIVPK